MNSTRRSILTLAGLSPFGSLAGNRLLSEAAASERAILSDFTAEPAYIRPDVNWRGFTDRVMGGVSNAEFGPAEIDGQRCMRMTGAVTRDSGGGFVQMALYFDGPSDASAYQGIELLVRGNDEDYNVHVRTSDCGWHNESYRATFHATSAWQTVRLPWLAFAPNGLSTPLDTARLQRVGLLGWMRDFEADLALGQITLYG